MLHILLDNGHGAETPGKRSPVWSDGSQLMEFSYTREVVNILAHLLDGAKKAYPGDYEVHIITPETKDISITERAKRANEIASKYGKENCIGISIHNNASQNGKAIGWEVHTYTGQSVADQYATCLWYTAKEVLGANTSMRADWSDKDPDWDSNFGILRLTGAPFMLTENLFMDNEKDCKFLLSAEGKTKIAKLHFDGILRCLAYYKANKDKKDFMKGIYPSVK